MTTPCAVAALIRSLLGCSPRFFPLRELQVWAPSWAAGFRVEPTQREGSGEELLPGKWWVEVEALRTQRLQAWMSYFLFRGTAELPTVHFL